MGSKRVAASRNAIGPRASPARSGPHPPESRGACELAAFSSRRASGITCATISLTTNPRAGPARLRLQQGARREGSSRAASASASSSNARTGPRCATFPGTGWACYYCYTMKAPDAFQVPGNSDKYPQHSIAQVLDRNPYTGARTFPATRSRHRRQHSVFFTQEFHCGWPRAVVDPRRLPGWRRARTSRSGATASRAASGAASRCRETSSTYERRQEEMDLSVLQGQRPDGGSALRSVWHDRGVQGITVAREKRGALGTSPAPPLLANLDCCRLIADVRLGILYLRL